MFAMRTFHDQRLRQRESLLQISRALTAQLDLTSVLQLVIDVSVELLAGTSGLIALAGDHGELRVAAASEIDVAHWPVFAPLLTTALEDRAGLTQALHSVSEATGLALRHMSALPLVLRGAAVGVIYVFRAAVNVGFTAEERDLLTAFADQAAIAVSNASLYQSVLRDKQRLDALIDASADGVMILDGRWRITTFNQTMERISGWPRDEAIGRPCAEVLGLRSDAGAALCPVECPLQRRPLGHDPLIEGWIDARDGVRRFVQSRYAIQLADDGSFLGALASVRDITRQKNEQEQQNTFISVISHELKTPVSIIRGYAETLGRTDATWDAETLRDGLHVIVEEADRLAAQIGDLLELSRLQAGGLRLTPSEWRLPPLLADVLSRFAPQVGDQFTFELRAPEDLPPVSADAERTRTVMENLIANAIKYSPDGGTIRVGAYVVDDRAVVWVSDQGIGIAPVDQARIFDRFYRVDNRVGRTTSGSGIGLYLARAIVEAQGGEIRVESQIGRGARFFFTLPLATFALADRPSSSVALATIGERTETGHETGSRSDEKPGGV